jgi:xanthine dehydrogenase YagT iron-sulfur-binding subunit
MMTLKSNDGTQIAGESGSEDVNEQPSSKVSTTSVARREFLKTSVLASGGILVASRLLTDGGVGGLEKVSAAAQSNPTESVSVRLRLNGANYGLRLDPRTSLLDVLREKIDLPVSRA